ncbi:MAG: hypothetical protein EOP50_09940, partial [Sphingobacteriales bacterium]
MKRILLPLLLCSLVACKKDKTHSGPIDNRGTGAAAHELLSADTYTSLQVEVSYMPGYAPDAAALSQLQAFLQARLNKPAGITVSSHAIPAASNTVLSVNDLETIEGSARTLHSGGSNAAVHVLCTNGTYSSNSVLGVAYSGTSVALFGQKIHENSGGIGQASRTKLEATVLEHEIGHLLGLVDNGTPMRSNHKDPNGTA